MRIRRSALLPMLLTLALAAAAFGDEGAPRTPKEGRIAKRLKSVETLVNTSSLARQIKDSGDAEAESLRVKAAGLLAEASRAFEAGDAAAAGELLIEAEKSLFRGVRLLSGGAEDDKGKRDFQHRLKSVRALLEAHKRVTDESEGGAEKKEASGRVADLIGRAMSLYDEGKVGEGRKALDEAYELATSSLRDMRAGMTKVRELKFETKKDEYDYVRALNDDYIKLAEQFLGEYLNNPGISEKAARMKEHFEKGKELRKGADARAGAEKYEEGIQTLEESTKEIKRAIRIAGFMIF